MLQISSIREYPDVSVRLLLHKTLGTNLVSAYEAYGGQSKNSARNKDPIDSVNQTEVWK